MGFWIFGKKGTETKILTKHKSLKIGLALGGGGARGLGHIGVLKAFEELGIQFDIVAGTSAGSIVGAFYADGYTSRQIADFASTLRKKDIKTSRLFFKPSKSSALAEVIREKFGEDKLIENLAKPFCAVAVDIKNGEEVDLKQGSVAQCCAGSSAVPGIFTPVIFENMHLVDGGLRNNVPADVVRQMGADVVIAVDVNNRRGTGTSSLKMFNILSSTIGVMMRQSVENTLKHADYVLTPDLSRFSSSKLDGMEDMIQEGYDCVMRNLDIIAPLISKKVSRKRKSKWKRIKSFG